MQAEYNYLHFIGVGGAGMRPLAKLALQADIKVSGSDQAVPQAPEGGDVELFWSPHNADKIIKRPDAIIISTAIPESNVELIWAREQGVEILHRSDLLEYLASQCRQQIVITGTHGKTSTTSLATWLLAESGLNPSWLIGGQPKGIPASHWSEVKDSFIFEGDESDQSFLKSNPKYGIITAIEPDHLENYGNSFDEQLEKFKEFAEKCETLICNIDDKNIQALVNSLSSSVKIITYSESELSEYPLNLSNLPGKHNQMNALAVLKLAKELNLAQNQIIEILNAFPGLGRRLERIAIPNSDQLIFDDYAHHPTEIRAAISSVREIMREKNVQGDLVVIFQPHHPHRMRDLWDEFLICFGGADYLYLTDLYLARGDHLPNVNSERFAQEIQHQGLTYCPGSIYNIDNIIRKNHSDKDVILIIGAGNITNIREPLVQSFSPQYKKNI